MISEPSYRKALGAALVFHVFLIILLITDTSSKKPALTKEIINTPGVELPMASTTEKPEVVRAVSVDNKQVMDTVNRLKQERAQQRETEIKRQRELTRQVEQAKQQRIQEQKKLAQLKEDANRIAVARKKQIEEEKKHLKQLAEEQAREAKHLAELQKQNKLLAQQQQLEKKKLAELEKKKAEDKAKVEKAEQVKIAQEKADLARKKQEEAAAASKQQAEQQAEQQAKIAGEVNKYKALIVNAIGRHWILPEKTNSTLSSQFRISLAPDGSVLEVSLTRTSGDPLLDRSAQTAIYKASPLPVPKDNETFNLFRTISLTVRPEQVRG